MFKISNSLYLTLIFVSFESTLYCSKQSILQYTIRAVSRLRMYHVNTCDHQKELLLRIRCHIKSIAPDKTDSLLQSITKNDSHKTHTMLHDLEKSTKANLAVIKIIRNLSHEYSCIESAKII